MYRVTIYDEFSHELEASFTTENVPYPELILFHDRKEWEVVTVRQHIRSEKSVAAVRNEPHLVDVLAREIEGLFSER